ncbi:MAG TPA: MBL fold metallo-hydrolase, partial [Polyangiaceae bacterium]|nr:MBL fold metallo-hydrolase [Polyangiaceae bacterium]
GRYTLTVDGASRLPLKVSSTTDHVNLGDVVVETEFGGYEQAGPLKLPTRITARLERDTVDAIRVTKSLVNAPAGDLAAPASVRAAPSAPPAPSVKVDELAPGVWLLAGGGAHSAVVEFADHLTLIEAPTDDARALAVIAKARELRPSKPLTEVVVTHHHFDHVGGVRAAISEGLEIVAHERAGRYLEAMASRPHTIAPDALAKRPRPLKLRAVGAEATLEDTTRTLRLYAAESRHADTMLVAHLPRERLLVEVDLYTAPPPNAPPLRYPHAPNLLEVVTSRKLDVDRVVPLHRQAVPLADLVAAAKQAPPPTAP